LFLVICVLPGCLSSDGLAYFLALLYLSLHSTLLGEVSAVSTKRISDSPHPASTMGQERRRSSRFRFSSPLTARELPPLGGAKGQTRLLKGKVENISAGGACVLTRKRLKESQIVHCELKIPNIPITIPTLMQVRWTVPRKEQFRSGLQFLL
jgi:hypothetical protein